jgi:3-hydroxybutyryl-CoA dehydratase
MSEIRKKTVQGLSVGDTFSVTRTFTEEEVIQFAGITKDYNPVHFDERFAKVKNFNSRICHGLLVASMVTEIGGQIGWLASGMDFVFKKPVFFGDTVTCSFTITELDDRGRARADAQFFQEDGELILEAVVTGIIPGDPEKEVLQAMLDEGDPTNDLS